MKTSELRDALDRILNTQGDLPVVVSCKQYQTDQGYLVSEPTTVEIDEYAAGKEVSIRDWAY